MSDSIQMFCLTYAGGRASFFDEIEKDVDGVEFVKLEYAGHGDRYKEPFYESFDQLSEDMYNLIKKQVISGRYALFGYSMGCIGVIEVLRRILAEGRIGRPCHVFLAAHEPRTKAELSGYKVDEIDQWVKERTIQFGAVPEKLINNNAFWRLYLPIFRADYELISQYNFENIDLRTDIPATIFYSENDTPIKNISLWKKYFTDECSFHCFDGTHFFISQHHKEIAGIIASTLYD